jgi:DNA-binding SARP family transcriptional activator
VGANKNIRTGVPRPVLAKVSAPRLTAALPRSALFKRLDQARRRALTVWLVAPAGSGKTMLAASYLKARGIKQLWYQLGEGDGDPATFFYYLREAAARIAPRARKLLPLLTPEYLLGLGTYTQNFFTQLGALFKAPFVLVFDNYQELPEDSPVHALLAQGLGTLPDDANALFLSHHESPSAYARLQVQRRQAVLGEAQLLLSLAETRALAQRYRFRTLTPKAIASLHDRTHGWAAGAVLMLEQAAQEHNPAPQFDQPVARTMFDYFVSEVLQRAPVAHQQVLLKTAMLPQLSARLAEALTGEKHAERILAELARKHYFTYRLPGAVSAYQYHPLFREFLRSQLQRTTAPEELTALRRRAAGLAEAEGNIEDAVHLWHEAEAWDELAPYLCRSAQELLKQGRGKILADWIEAIPSTTREADPWLLFWLGQSCLAARFAEARSHFEKAHACFLSRHERDGALLAWAGIVDTIVHEFDDLTRLDPWIEWLNVQMASAPGFPSGAIGFRVISSMAVAQMFRRDRREEVLPWIERASVVLEQLPDLSARCRLAVYLALYATWVGDLGRLETLALDIRRWSRQVQGGSPPGIEAQYVNYVKSLHEWIAGISDYGLHASNEALTLIEDSGIRLLERHMIARAAFGALCSGALAEAKDHLDRLRQLAAASPSSRLHLFQYHYLPGWHSLLAGNSPKALQEAQQSLQVSREAGITVFHQGFSNLVAAHALLDTQRQEEAQLHINAVLEIARKFGSPILEFSGLLVQAHRDLAGNEPARNERGLIVLRQALALGKRQRYLNTVVWYPAAMASLCQTAIEQDIEAEYVQQLIRRRSLLPPSSSDRLEHWPWPLRLYTLGRFSIVKDGAPAAFEGRAQKKALDLLKALIAFGGQGVSEQKLCDALWAGAEADDARRNFKVTLHRLRALIGHETLILRESRLVLDPRRCWVDVQAFEPMLDRIAASSGSLAVAELQRLGEQALALYRGAFLADDEASFAITSRERLRAKLMRAITALVERLLGEGLTGQALGWYEKGIGIEPLAESFYQGLMRACLALRRPAEGLAAYERCRKTLGAQLQISPSPETETLAKALRSSGNAL